MISSYQTELITIQFTLIYEIFEIPHYIVLQCDLDLYPQDQQFSVSSGQHSFFCQRWCSQLLCIPQGEQAENLSHIVLPRSIIHGTSIIKTSILPFKLEHTVTFQRKVGFKSPNKNKI